MQVSSGLCYSMPALKMYRRVFVHAGSSKNLEEPTVSYLFWTFNPIFPSSGRRRCNER